MISNFNVVEHDELMQEPGSMEDVVGLSNFKKLLEEIIIANNNADAFNNADVPKPRGIIFCGPPGTGKTLVAKNAAKKLGYNYMYLSPSSLRSPIGAITTKKIEKAFETAADSGANTIMFIDEIDGIIKDRATGGSDGDGALQKFLEMLDGNDNKNRTHHLLVIVATNHIEHLDAAFIRPGRFDEKIYFGLPGPVEREDFILKYLGEGVDVAMCIEITDGFSYAELNAFSRKAKWNSLIYNTGLDEGSLLHAAQTIISGSSSNEAVTDPKMKKHLIPHITGHTLAYIFDPSVFTLGSSSDSAQMMCAPKLVPHRISTRKELILKALSILLAQVIEIRTTGDASTLSINDQKELDSVMDKILALFGAEQSGNVSMVKLKKGLASIMLKFVNKMLLVIPITELADSIADEYTRSSVITRRKLKDLMGNHSISDAITTKLYDVLISSIESTLKLDMTEAAAEKARKEEQEKKAQAAKGSKSQAHKNKTSSPKKNVPDKQTFGADDQAANEILAY